MDKYIIEIEKLGKRYRLGQLESYYYNSLRESVAALAGACYGKITGKKAALGDGTNETANTLWAVRDVSLKLRMGEVVGIIGRNGAGKSTLLKLLSRITEPTEGRAVIRGRVGSLLEIGTGFHPELTGRENIYLNGAMLGMTRSEISRKFREIVDFSEIDTFLDTPIKRYSSGMLVRLGFSVAAHLMPEILIVDEVLAVGDLAFQNKCLRHIKRLTESGMAIILVSHDMDAIRLACDRVLLMHEGRILEEGKPAVVIDTFRKLLEKGHATSTARGINKDGSQAQVIIENVQLYGEDGQIKREFKFGERISVRIDIDSPTRIENPMVAFRILRADGTVVCNFNNWYDNFNMEYLDGKCSVEAWIPPLRIIPNHYTVNVIVWYWGGRMHGDLGKGLPLAYQEFGHFRVTGPPMEDREIFQQPAERWRFSQNGRTLEHDKIGPDSIYDAFETLINSD